jgi:hypothetical protein
MESSLGILPEECTRKTTANLAVGLAIVLMLSAALGWSGMLGLPTDATATPVEQSGNPYVMRPYGDARLISG